MGGAKSAQHLKHAIDGQAKPTTFFLLSIYVPVHVLTSPLLAPLRTT